jgi:plastocyanin
VSVTIKDFAFSPASLEIAIGETVTWTNEDSAAHTVTGDDGIDSGSLAQGKSFTHTFKSAGTFSYRCSIHPNMTGKVTVK